MMGIIFAVFLFLVMRQTYLLYKEGPSYFFEEIDELKRELKWEHADRVLYKVDPQLAIDLGFDPTRDCT